MAEMKSLDTHSSANSDRSTSHATTLISLKILKPSVWASDDATTPTHIENLNLGLHIPKRYLTIAQRAAAIEPEVYLRFCVSIDDISFSASTETNTTKLFVEAKARIRQEIMYSRPHEIQSHQEYERALVHMNCTLPAKDLEVGTKLVIEPKNESDEEDFQYLVATMESLKDDENIPYLPQQHVKISSVPHGQSGVGETITNRALHSNLEIPTSMAPSTSEKDLQASASDMWAGLEQLELQFTQKQVPDLVSTSNETPSVDTKTSPSSISMTNITASAVSSRPITPADGDLNLNTISAVPSGTGCQQSVWGDVSDLQPLPNVISPSQASGFQKWKQQAVARVRNTAPASSKPQDNIESSGPVPTIPALQPPPTLTDDDLRSRVAEETIMRNWDASKAKWGSLGKDRHYKDADFKCISEDPADKDAELDQANTTLCTSNSLSETQQTNREENINPWDFTSNSVQGNGFGTFERGRGRGSAKTARLSYPARDQSSRGYGEGRGVSCRGGLSGRGKYERGARGGRSGSRGGEFRGGRARCGTQAGEIRGGGYRGGSQVGGSRGAEFRGRGSRGREFRGGANRGRGSRCDPRGDRSRGASRGGRPGDELHTRRTIAEHETNGNNDHNEKKETNETNLLLEL